MSSRYRALSALTGLLFWASAGCNGSNGSNGGTGGSAGATTTGSGGKTGTGGATTTTGTGGTTTTSGTGGAGAGGRTDGGVVDAGATDAPKNDGGATTGDGGDARADAGPAGGDARDGAGDGAPAFAPCPADGGACVVMPLGDSITEGFPDLLGGYRVELFHQANLAGKSITFVGRRMNGPASGMVDGKLFPNGCEGYSGFTIANAPTITRSGITELTVPAINMFHPHVILLMIGTNDINQNYMVATAPDRLASLIDMITTAAPSTLLVVAQIVPTTTDATNTRIQAYNAAIPALVQTRASAGKHVLLVDMYTTFTSRANYKTALMVDDLHPNPAGYTLLGQTWYGMIAPYVR